MIPPLMLLAISSRAVATVLCGALLLIVLLQVRHDATSRAFAGLIGSIALNAILSLILRLVSAVGGDITGLFRAVSVTTAALPLMLILFVAEYFNAWAPLQRVSAGMFAVFIPVVGALSFSGALSADVYVRPDGLLNYRLTPLAYALLLTGAIGVLIALYTAWGSFITQRSRRARWDTQMLIGVTIVGSGSFVVLVPVLTAYTIEQVAYAAGTLVLAPPVLRQRLFDPLAQLNTRLARRAEQFATITQVSQQANSSLHLSHLLTRTASQIQDAFGCYAVAIYLPMADGKLVVQAAAGEAAAALVASGHSRTLDGEAEPSHNLHPAARSAVSLPLLAAPESESEGSLMVGLLEIKSARVAAFSEDEMEAFHILANQVATAIRNAQLFEQAQQSDRYKTRFIHSISHELRSPLQTIIGQVAFLAHPQSYEGVTLTDAYLRDLDMAAQSARHLHALLDGILDLGRIEAGQIELQIEAVDPGDAWHEVIHNYLAQLQPNVRLVCAYAVDLPRVAADRLRLVQILGNLVSNACKYTAEGTITLDADIREGFLWFCVRDTGVGIPASEHARLFTSFGQVSRGRTGARSGVGLGLSISRQLARLQGGDVWFESVEGNGSTFYCSVPLAADDIAESPYKPESPSRAIMLGRPSNLPEQIVVVGAEIDRQAYMHIAPEGWPAHRLVAAKDIEEALEFAHAIKPRCIVVVGQSDGEVRSTPEAMVSRGIPRAGETQVIFTTREHWKEAVASLSSTQGQLAGDGE